jgi:hypothetical protein
MGVKYLTCVLETVYLKSLAKNPDAIIHPFYTPVLEVKGINCEDTPDYDTGP